MARDADSPVLSMEIAIRVPRLVYCSCTYTGASLCRKGNVRNYMALYEQSSVCEKPRKRTTLGPPPLQGTVGDRIHTCGPPQLF